MLFWGAVRDLLWILLLLLELFLLGQPEVSQHYSLPSVIALCLSLPPDIWLGRWALYLTDSTGRNLPMHALAWVSAFYGRSWDPQESSWSKYLQADEAVLPASTPALS